MFQSHSNRKSNQPPNNARRLHTGTLERIGIRRDASADANELSSKRRRMNPGTTSSSPASARAVAVPAGGSASDPPLLTQASSSASSAYDRFDERGWLRGLAWQIRRAVNRPSNANPIRSPVSTSSLKRTASGRMLTKSDFDRSHPDIAPPDDSPAHRPGAYLQTDIPSHSLSFASIFGGPASPSPLDCHPNGSDVGPIVLADEPDSTVSFGPRRTGVYRDQSVQADFEQHAIRPRLDVPDMPTLPSLHLTPPEKKKSLISELFGTADSPLDKPDKGKGKQPQQEEQDSDAAVERAQQAALALGELLNSGGLSARAGKTQPDVAGELARSFIPLDAVAQRNRTDEDQTKEALSEEATTHQSSSNALHSSAGSEQSSDSSSDSSSEPSSSSSSDSGTADESDSSQEPALVPASAYSGEPLPPSQFAAAFTAQDGHLDIDALLNARGELAASQTHSETLKPEKPHSLVQELGSKPAVDPPPTEPVQEVDMGHAESSSEEMEAEEEEEKEDRRLDSKEGMMLEQAAPVEYEASEASEDDSSDTEADDSDSESLEDGKHELEEAEDEDEAEGDLPSAAPSASGEAGHIVVLSDSDSEGDEPSPQASAPRPDLKVPSKYFVSEYTNNQPAEYGADSQDELDDGSEEERDEAESISHNDAQGETIQRKSGDTQEGSSPTGATEEDHMTGAGPLMQATASADEYPSLYGVPTPFVGSARFFLQDNSYPMDHNVDNFAFESIPGWPASEDPHSVPEPASPPPPPPAAGPAPNLAPLNDEMMPDLPTEGGIDPVLVAMAAAASQRHQLAEQPGQVDPSLLGVAHASSSVCALDVSEEALAAASKLDPSLLSDHTAKPRPEAHVADLNVPAKPAASTSAMTASPASHTKGEHASVHSSGQSGVSTLGSNVAAQSSLSQGQPADSVPLNASHLEVSCKLRSGDVAAPVPGTPTATDAASPQDLSTMQATAFTAEDSHPEKGSKETPESSLQQDSSHIQRLEYAITATPQVQNQLPEQRKQLSEQLLQDELPSITRKDEAAGAPPAAFEPQTQVQAQTNGHQMSLSEYLLGEHIDENPTLADQHGGEEAGGVRSDQGPGEMFTLPNDAPERASEDGGHRGMSPSQDDHLMHEEHKETPIEKAFQEETSSTPGPESEDSSDEGQHEASSSEGHYAHDDDNDAKESLGGPLDRDDHAVHSDDAEEDQRSADYVQDGSDGSLQGDDYDEQGDDGQADNGEEASSLTSEEEEDAGDQEFPRGPTGATEVIELLSSDSDDASDEDNLGSQAEDEEDAQRHEPILGLGGRLRTPSPMDPQDEGSSDEESDGGDESTTNNEDADDSGGDDEAHGAKDVDSRAGSDSSGED